MPSPRQLSRQLRLETDADLRRRRWVVGLSDVGVLAGVIVGLYQTGVIRRLPDPPGRVFDSSRVDAADYAYKRLQTPDGLLMTLTYAVTAILAGAGGRERAREQPLLPLAMAGKVAYDAYVTVKLAGEEWQETRAMCAYCQAATLAALASLALALPEAARAARNLLGRG